MILNMENLKDQNDINDVRDSSNFTKEEASIYLRKKLFGQPPALQHTIFEAVWRIENGNYNIQSVLNWYDKIEEVYNSKNIDKLN